MQPYLRTRGESERNATVTGLVITGAVHLLAAVACLLFGLTYLYPPPPELTFLMDFSEDIEMVEEVPVPGNPGPEAQAEEPNNEEKVELVQQSTATHTSTKPNTTPSTKPDTHGDVPVDKPEKEPELDPRASFPGMSTSDNTSTTPHSATETGETNTPGQPDGNTTHGKTEGEPSANLQGRRVDGHLYKPEFEGQAEGVVVVTIKVDNYGEVKEATPGAPGTTITDKALWTAARKAAMKTRFNKSASAEPLQVGTITYIFKLQ